ncbi:MAG: shikimate kinase [Rhodanobacter sp.]
MNPSSNLFIVGATGAGKTSIGRRLAAHYGLAFIDLDQEIERHTGVNVGMVFEIEGEAGFRERESALLDERSQRTGIAMATGAGAVLAPANRERLTTRGFVVWLQTNVEQQLQRLQRDDRRPLLGGMDRAERLRGMAHVRTPLYAAMADLAVPGAQGTVASACARCVSLIDQHWQRLPTPAAQAPA